MPQSVESRRALLVKHLKQLIAALILQLTAALGQLVHCLDGGLAVDTAVALAQWRRLQEEPTAENTNIVRAWNIGGEPLRCSQCWNTSVDILF